MYIQYIFDVNTVHAWWFQPGFGKSSAQFKVLSVFSRARTPSSKQLQSSSDLATCFKVGLVLFLVYRPTFPSNTPIGAPVTLWEDTMGLFLPIASICKQINKLSLMSLSHPEEDKGTWKTPCESLSYGKLWSPDLYRLSHCLWASGGKSKKQEWKKKKSGVNICHTVRESKSAKLHLPAESRRAKLAVTPDSCV